MIPPYHQPMALELDAPINCTSFKTRQLARLVARHFDVEIGKVGLKSTQYSLLTHVLHRGPLTTKELADRMGLDISTLTRNMKPLIDQKWVIQAVGTDARTRVVNLSAQGIAMQKAAHLHWHAAQRTINALIGQYEVEELHTLMNAAIEKIKEEDLRP
jgi:DNA-binding MarR family transcriptional regulator